jgi:hypothetical protein
MLREVDDATAGARGFQEKDGPGGENPGPSKEAVGGMTALRRLGSSITAVSTLQ